MRGVGYLLEDRALRPVLVIRAFAYLLADITVTAMGRMGPVSTIVSIPLFGRSAGCAAALCDASRAGAGR